MPCQTCSRMMKHSFNSNCSSCSADLAGADNPCPDCRRIAEQSSLDGLSSIGPWMGPLREWLSLLKYGGDVRLVQWLVIEFFNMWTLSGCNLPVVPVPPRYGRIHHEGRYIVYLIADRLEKHGIPVQKILCREDKMAQKDLNREERLAGMRLNYRVKKSRRIHGSYILLDDVSTTGSTLSRCASVLKNAGAADVFAMVVCRA